MTDTPDALAGVDGDGTLMAQEGDRALTKMSDELIINGRRRFVSFEVSVSAQPFESATELSLRAASLCIEGLDMATAMFVNYVEETR